MPKFVIKKAKLNNGSINVREGKDALPLYELTLKLTVEDISEASKFLTVYRGNYGNLEFNTNQLTIDDKLQK